MSDIKPQLLASTAMPATAEEIERWASQVVDGIYFGLPDAVYHAVPRLSASGIQNLCVSPANFWRGSWLDPDRPELDEEATKAQILGKAYHCARLEPDQFEKRYCRAIEKDSYDLTSDAAIKAELKRLGEPQTQGDESILDRASRLMAAGYEGTIYHIALDEWEQARNGRIPIAPSYYDDIVRDMERLLGCKQVADLFDGGQSEVAIFWTDEHGIQMKQKVDRLCRDRILDFKTFENKGKKRLDQAIADAVRFNRYHVQAASYRDGVEAIKANNLQVQGEATDEQRKLVAEIQIAPKPHEFWFVFQEKNGVPNLLARQFKFYSLDAYRETEIEALVEEGRQDEIREAMGRKTEIYQIALAEIRYAKQQFALYSQVYEPGRPWAPIEPIGTLDDLDFPSGWLEGKWQ